MITDDEVMRLFEQADPARTTDDHNNTPDATGDLAALRTRSNNVTYIDTTEESTGQPANRRWYMIGAAVAAVAILLVGGVALLTANEDASEPVVPATAPPTVAPPTVAPPTVAPLRQDAVGRASEFLAAFASGDPAAVEASQGEGFEMRYSWPNEGFGDALGQHEWLGVTYQSVVRTVYVDPSCTTSGEAAGLVTVECETTMRLAAHQLTNSDGVPAVVTLAVTTDGIAGMDSAYGSQLGLLPFYEWQDLNGFDVLSDEFQSEEESIEFGRTEEQLAAEWVAFAIDAVEGAFADYNAGQLEDFLARFAPGEPFTSADDETIAALIAGGTRHEQSNCEPAGVEPPGLRVVCDLVIEHASHGVSGVRVEAAIGFVIAANGTIVENADSVDWQPLISLNRAFKQWLQDAHPDVHDEVTWLDALASADDQATVAEYYEEFVAQSDVYPLGG